MQVTKTPLGNFGLSFLPSMKPMSRRSCLKRLKGDIPTKPKHDSRRIKPFPMLDIDDEARSLAEKIIQARAVPAEYPEDALHIAVAAVNGIEVVITWNFAHLNNPFTRKMVRHIVESEGYECPEICSPEELLEVDK